MRNLFSILAIVVCSNAFAQNAFDVSITPTSTDISNVYVLFGAKPEESSLAFTGGVADSAAVGTTTTASFNTNADPAIFNYGLLATYGESGVTIGVDSAVANTLVGRSWSSIFSDFTESSVRSSLVNNDFAGQFQFAKYVADLRFDLNGQQVDLLANVGEQVTLLNFSDASRNGGANVSAVPEPASIAALSLGALLLRRRKSAK